MDVSFLSQFSLKLELNSNFFSFNYRLPKPNFQSQFFSQSYESNLPTSLIYIVLINQRLLTLETCCGYEYDLNQE